MKCEFCTGNIRIEDAVCPHCGKENPFYKAHREDLANFTNEFEKTKNEAIETNVRHTKKAVQITIIAVLVALILTSVIVLLSMEDIYNAMDKRNNIKHADEIIATLHKYEDERDFYNFSNYYMQHYNGMYSYGYNDFSAVEETVSSYESIAYSISAIATDENYQDAPALALDTERNLGRIYALYEDAKKHPDKEAYSAEHMETVDYILNDIYCIFRAYLGLTDDEINSLTEKSPSERQLMFEKKFERMLADEEEQ